MIDTIRIQSPEINLKIINEITKELKNSGNGHKMLRNPKWLKIKDNFNNAIRLKISQSSTLGKFNITVEASVHKILVGHNVYGGPKDMKASIKYLINHMENILKINLPPSEEWEVHRVDIANNFILKNKEAINQFFIGLLFAEYPRRNCTIRYDKHGLYITGSTTTINIYHKLPEFKLHEYKRLKMLRWPPDDLSELLDIAKNTIRAEVQIHKRKLKNDFEEKPLLVKDLDDSYFNNLFNKEITKLLKEAEEGYKLVRNFESVDKRLKNQCNPRLADQLLATYIRLCLNGERQVSKSMNKATFRNHIKQLIALGISWNRNDIMFPELCTVPEDFSLIPGNKYHDDSVLPEIDRKLKRYY